MKLCFVDLSLPESQREVYEVEVDLFGRTPVLCPKCGEPGKVYKVLYHICKLDVSGKQRRTGESFMQQFFHCRNRDMRDDGTGNQVPVCLCNLTCLENVVYDKEEFDDAPSKP